MLGLKGSKYMMQWSGTVGVVGVMVMEELCK